MKAVCLARFTFEGKIARNDKKGATTKAALFQSTILWPCHAASNECHAESNECQSNSLRQSIYFQDLQFL